MSEQSGEVDQLDRCGELVREFARQVVMYQVAEGPPLALILAQQSGGHPTRVAAADAYKALAELVAVVTKQFRERGASLRRLIIKLATMIEEDVDSDALCQVGDCKYTKYTDAWTEIKATFLELELPSLPEVALGAQVLPKQDDAGRSLDADPLKEQQGAAASQEIPPNLYDSLRAAIQAAKLTGAEARLVNAIIERGGRLLVKDADVAIGGDATSAFKRAKRKLLKQGWRLYQFDSHFQGEPISRKQGAK